MKHDGKPGCVVLAAGSARRFGGNKHAGFGLGFERMVMYLTGISNIRDVLPFPRTTGSAEF